MIKKTRNAEGHNKTHLIHPSILPDPTPWFNAFLWILLAICLVNVAGCGKVSRPDTDICGINAVRGHQKCYNLKRHYTNDGKLRRDAKAFYKPAISILDLNKNICTDGKGWGNLKVYVKQLRKKLERCERK